MRRATEPRSSDVALAAAGPVPGGGVVAVRGMSRRVSSGVVACVGAAGVVALGTAGALVPGRWPILVVVAGVSLAVLGVFWLLERRASRCERLVCEAVRESERVGDRPEVLSVQGGLGETARSWNKLLNRLDELSRQRTEEELCALLASGAREHRLAFEASASLSQGLVVVGEKLEVRYANGAALGLLGAAGGAGEFSAGNEQIERLLPEASAMAAVRAALGGTKRQSVVELDRTGPECPCLLRVSVRRLPRGESPSVLVVVEDVTQQRTAESARELFVAQATHELRTPLTNIRLYADSLIGGPGEKLTDSERAQALNVIHHESQRLERIVADMLSVSEMDSGAYSLKRDDVRLDVMLREMQAEFALSAREKGLDFGVTLPPKLPVLQGERDKLAIAIRNLLGNAVKYTPQGGRVQVDVAVESGRVRVDVTDTGIGIGPADLPRIFERFYRAQDSRVHEVTGTGLGLSLAREVARLHGGEITVKSEPERGSTFTLTLPTPVVARAAA